VLLRQHKKGVGSCAGVMLVFVGVQGGFQAATWQREASASAVLGGTLNVRCPSRFRSLTQVLRSCLEIRFEDSMQCRFARNLQV
jgi:hypothetical protein